MNGEHGEYSGRRLPPYTYVSGRTPHPVSDPAGHLFGESPSPPMPIDVDRWRENTDYLYGVDLFNQGYYWEAHEVWESLWHAAHRVGPVADFLKGLIKLAAAGVKAYEGRPTGVRRHAARAATLFAAAAPLLASSDPSLSIESLYGLPLSQLLRLAEDLQRNPPHWTSDKLPEPGLLGGLTLQT